MGAGPVVPTGGGLHVNPDLLERSDAELLAASRTGDQEAYGELFRRHVSAATALARRLTGHPADADDLVSEAFTKVLAALKNGHGPTSALRPYLLTAVRRVHVDRATAAQRVQPTDDIGAHDPGVPFVDSALLGLERSMVAQAYRQLPERWQMVLWHTEVEELSPKDIAPLLGMSPNAVAALALRARAGLREAYLAAHVTTTNSPECERMLPKLAAYVRGSAAAREKAAVERHLPDCEDCRAVLAELQDVGGRMRAVIAPLILGVAATGYLADIAAFPAIAAPPAVAATTAAAASGAGAGAAGLPVVPPVPPPGGGTAAAAAGSSSAGGGGAGATAAGGQLAGWLVGAAATVIVAGAVAGAVVLGNNSPGIPADSARRTNNSTEAGSKPSESGAGLPIIPTVGPSTPPSMPPLARSSSPSPSAASPTTTPSAATLPTSSPAPTNPPSTPTISTTPPLVPPTTPPSSTPPVDEPTVTPTPVTTPAPAAAWVVGGEGQLYANPGAGSSGALTIDVPAYDTQIDVTIALPAGITSDVSGLAQCVAGADVVTCTGVQGQTINLPITAAVAGDYSLTITTSGPVGSNITSTPVSVPITIAPQPVAPAAAVTPGSLYARPDGSSGEVAVGIPSSPHPLNVTIGAPADLQFIGVADGSTLPAGCTVQSSTVSCAGVGGPQTFALLVGVSRPGSYTITSTVAAADPAVNLAPGNGTHPVNVQQAPPQIAPALPATGGESADLVIEAPASAYPLTLVVTVPNELRLGTLPSTCTAEPGETTTTITCTDVQPRTALPVLTPTFSTSADVQAYVVGAGVQSEVTNARVAVPGRQLAPRTETGQITTVTIGNTFEANGDQSGPSSATLDLPSTNIRYARLYWAGTTTDGPGSATMSLTGPQGTPQVIAAQASERLATGSQSFISAADVTQLVRDGIAAGGTSTSWTGGPTESFEHGNMPFAGWTLVVIAAQDGQSATQVTISDNNVAVGSFETTATAGATAVQLVAWGGRPGAFLGITFDSAYTVASVYGSGFGDGAVENMDLVTITSPAPGGTLQITGLGVPDRLVLGTMITSRPVE